MSETLKIIRGEHRRLAAVITCFTGVLQDIEERSLAPDFELFEAVLSYFENFLYRFHHPKEDQHLFPLLQQRSAELGEVIARLESEHAQGLEILAALRSTLDDYRHNHAQGFGGFYAAAMQYRDFEWKHMATEERQLLPQAAKLLTESDWQQLDAVFTAHDDPLFGDRPQAEFAELLSKIVNQAPAPHGLA